MRYRIRTSAMTVMTRIARATTFARMCLSFMDPKEDMKLPMAVDMKIKVVNLAILMYFMTAVRSMVSFMATPSRVREVGLREK